MKKVWFAKFFLNNSKLSIYPGVQVWIEVWVQEITALNEITSDFEMDIYVTELWVNLKKKVLKITYI